MSNKEVCEGFIMEMYDLSNRKRSTEACLKSGPCITVYRHLKYTPF